MLLPTTSTHEIEAIDLLPCPLTALSGLVENDAAFSPCARFMLALDFVATPNSKCCIKTHSLIHMLYHFGCRDLDDHGLDGGLPEEIHNVRYEKITPELLRNIFCVISS